MNMRAVMQDIAVRQPPVVACLDRSRHAAGVLAHAMAMAGLLGAPLRVVQALEPPTDADERPDPLDWAIRRLEARATLNRLVAATQNPAHVAEASVALLHGRAADEIRRECRRQRAALVVLGMQGEHATGSTNGPGATARALIEDGAGMVLLAPETTSAGQPRCGRILVPLDGSSWSATALPVAARLARVTGAAVTLAQVVAAPDPAGALPPEREDIDLRARLVDRDEQVARAHLERLRRSLADQGVDACALTVRGDDARVALSDLLAHRTFDLVVMSAGGHGCERLPGRRCGGVAAHLAGRSPIPLLIVQPAATQVSRSGGRETPPAQRKAPAPPAETRLHVGADW